MGDSNSHKLQTLFRTIAKSLGLLSDAEVVSLDAAVVDMREELDSLYSELLPKFRSMGGNGPVDLTKTLDLLIELKVKLEHIQFHLHEAIPALDRFIEEASRLDKGKAR